MNLQQQFVAHILQEKLFLVSDELLVSVSGGVDSAVLCELCKQAGFSFSIAHCNFQLRGEESERDEKFVRDLAVRYGVPFYVKKFETGSYASEHKLSIQEAARKLRYDWFAELIVTGTAKSRYLLTAHHADDNAETVAMHFFRGTGLHGLTGIPASSGHIRRPLLPFTKDQLLSFANENQLPFVEDSSNKSSKYTRNFFRNDILPAISEVYPQVMQNIRQNISRFKEIEALYRLSTGTMIKKLCRQKGAEVHVPVQQLLKYDSRALVFELISPFGFSPEQVPGVIKLAESASGSYIEGARGDHRIIRHRHWLIIAPVAAKQADLYVISAPGEYHFPGGNLFVKEISEIKPGTHDAVVSLDSKQLQFPMLLRKWKTGDYFYPLGMRKKKKVSRFLIDQKLSKTQKENTWVIECQNRICWVVGHRIDDRFKITPNTKQALRFSVSQPV